MVMNEPILWQTRAFDCHCAGASGDMIEKVAAQMVAEKVVRIDRAKELVNT
jgi:hypothetical protein